MKLLAQILCEITQHPRQQVIQSVDFEWSDKSWTHNIFRLYELIFWRRYGIKHEMSKDVVTGVEYAHTWEATLALIEVMVRKALTFKLRPFRVYIPVLQTPQGIAIPASPFLFAIAFDTSAAVSNTANISIAYTVTGSNVILICSGCDNAVASVFPTNCTYNSVNLTSAIMTLNQAQSTVGGNFKSAFYYLLAPATGSNTFALTWVSTPNNGFVFLASYSGVKQSGFPDSSATGDTASDTSWVATTTVVASNCWLIHGANNTANTCTLSAGVFRQDSGLHNGIGDSNATVGTGSQSVTYTLTAGSSAAFWYILSLAPVGVAKVIRPNLLLMGTG